jgi:eukaryotic-like serine/threonine-protein kinase
MSTPTPDEWHTLSPYLDEALAMPDAERSLWLSSLRSQNPNLVDQLESLLSEHRALSEKGFLEQRPAHLRGNPGLQGQTIGVYTLVSQIGQGGMGSVWLAERNDGRFEPG